MINPRWNEEERKCYERLAKTGNGKDPEGIEGLAFTAVNETYLNRIDRENREKFYNEVTEAIEMMSTGICRLEDRLGFRIREMADRRFAKEFNRIRNDTENICAVLYAMRREYVDMTTAHGPMGDHVGTCKTIKVDALEDFIDRMCKAMGLEWKDVVSYAEDANAKA